MQQSAPSSPSNSSSSSDSSSDSDFEPGQKPGQGRLSASLSPGFVSGIRVVEVLLSPRSSALHGGGDPVRRVG